MDARRKAFSMSSTTLRLARLERRYSSSIPPELSSRYCGIFEPLLASLAQDHAAIVLADLAADAAVRAEGKGWREIHPLTRAVLPFIEDMAEAYAPASRPTRGIDLLPSDEPRAMDRGEVLCESHPDPALVTSP